jgi:hypothetical protein
MFTNQNNLSINQRVYLQKVGTKSLHSRYTVSGILARLENKKSPNTNSIKAFSFSAGLPAEVPLGT